MAYKVHVLYDGFSKMEDGQMKANCSCTLVKGPTNMIVDTMTAWDKDKILSGLAKHNISCDDISYAVGTHGHSDHLGNLNLFLMAKHIVGFTVSHKEDFFIHPFETGEPYKIDDDLLIIPTPGHTTADVSVIVKTEDLGTVVIAGCHRRINKRCNVNGMAFYLLVPFLQKEAKLTTVYRQLIETNSYSRDNKPKYSRINKILSSLWDKYESDLFECEADIEDPSLWKYVAGSEKPESQEKHRNEMLLKGDYIIPGHGPMFKVTNKMRDMAKQTSKFDNA